MAPPKKTPVVTPQAKKPNTTPIIIGAIVGVAVLVVVALVIVLASGGDSGPDVFKAGATISENQGVEVSGTDLVSFGGDAASDPALGVEAPGLTGAFFDGTPVSIEPGNGKPYMLVFLAHWCPHCNAEVPRLVEWYESGAVPADLQVVGIATGSDATAANWPPSRWLTKTMSWPYPTWQAMADTPTDLAAQTYGLDGYPFMVMVGSDGKVLARHSGEFSDVGAIATFVTNALATDGLTPTSEAPTDSTADTTADTVAP